MKKTFWSLAIIFAFTFACFAQDGDAMKKTDTNEQTQMQTATQFSAELLDTIDVEKSKRSDDFQLELNDDLRIGDKTLEKGTKINGRVVRSEKLDEGKDSSLVSLYLGSVKEGDEYFRFNANIVSIGDSKQSSSEEMQFTTSPNFKGATIITMKAKNLRFEKGTVFQLQVNEPTN